MGTSILKKLLGIAASILGIRLGNAILNLLDIKPEIWILGPFMGAPTEAWLEVARWALALAIVLIIWLAWHLIQVKRNVWAERDQLELSAIANLSVGKPISAPMDVEPQLSRHRALKDAVMSAELKTVNMRGRNPNVMTLIKREDLRAYANASQRSDLLSVLRKWDKLNPPRPVEEASQVDAAPQAAVSNNPKFMKAIELRELLKATNDWDFKSDGHAIDIQRAFRQSALRDEFEVWGKMKSPSSFQDERVSLKIPCKYWEDGTLDISHFMHSGDNETISTRIENIPKKKTEPVYYDLEVSRKEAIEWVKGNAKNYKGYSDAQRAKNLGK